MSVPSVSPPASLARAGWVSALALMLLLLWDASGADMAVARWMGTPLGFAARSDFFWAVLMHEGGKALAWALLLGLLLAARWPVGLLRRLTRAQRWQLALVPLAAVALVTLLKQHSQTSCPWDLQAFGGGAPWVSHWAWGQGDGGPGHCFPAGHATSALCFAGGWFVLRPLSARAAALWLAASLAAGLVLGLGQQWRGAHFMSHTLWSAWLCWMVGFAAELLLLRARQALRHRSRMAPARS
ncbi:phosphatase PAP2 family protein [Xenophilus arseniciresistens]|uniref:Phosphatase PAP2 family protein n=1 Tax=Xenophilus arseniciresistens TaxID=1283306 RepID=A0AAE3N3H3_9BURK|nr:phosphatase PAP2 family protein [Xenophilus arseniciresistens]MDA7414865.1 phosphatase PAP2 family protein [Xenophilus arseniciresistens]